MTELAIVGQCARHHEKEAVKRCARCGDNLCVDCAAAARNDVCGPCLDRLETRGRVPHVEWLAVVTMVHGVLMLLMAAFMLLYMAVFGASLAGQSAAPGVLPDEFLGILGGLGLVLSVLLGVPGALQLVAGWYMRSFRYRWLSLLALAGGLLLSVISCVGIYCIPSAFALTVWGAFVLFDDAVAKRFAAEATKP